MLKFAIFFLLVISFNQILSFRLSLKSMRKNYDTANQANVDKDLLDPNTIFPDKTWAWEKAPPKYSLTTLDNKQNATATPLILNLIETVHWLTFPLGFYLSYFIYENSVQLSHLPALNNDPNRLFFIILGLLSQVFGGGISFNLVHEYESWQITPFRNILNLSNDPTLASKQIELVKVQKYNNAWLRAVAYQFLFSFQAIGLGFFTVGAFGVTIHTSLLIIVTALIALLGPKQPRLKLKNLETGNPVLPLSVSLAIVFAINIIITLIASIHLFQPVLNGKVLFGNFGAIFLSVIGPLLQGFGGAYEGYFAEGKFNQWDHLIAISILSSGVIAQYFVYSLVLGIIQ